MIRAATRSEWRDWLMSHHGSETEAWLVYYKKHTGKPSISYIESVKEALCFGWIDGIKKRIDDETYTHRFTPRRPTSQWSANNVRLARELIESGDMTAAGLRAFEQRKEIDEEALKNQKAAAEILTPETEKQLKSHQQAWDNFNRLPPGYRKQYILWLQTARRRETREKRLEEAISLLSQNKHLGMK